LANCLICGTPVTGSALAILESWICAECENRLLGLRPGEDGYDAAIAGLRLLWRDLSVGCDS
jgi:hypothetical protein